MNLEQPANGSAVSVTVTIDPKEELKRTIDKLNMIIEGMLEETQEEKCCLECSC